jgi:hypothetical protein
VSTAHFSESPNKSAGESASSGASLVRRSLLIETGLALSVVVAIGLGVFGVGYVNVDSLNEHPLVFTLVILGPALGASLSLVLAALPRTLQINLMVLLSLWVVLEMTFGVINSRRPKVTGSPNPINDHDYYVDDPILGYKAGPNSIARHTESYGKRQLYSVTYQIDELGRRSTPVDSSEPRPKFLLFFGDSNTFGDGLEQRQTLPYYAGQLARQYQPYNYAFSGWGPAQMLDLLQVRNIPSETSQREGYAIFFFIKDHLGRVIGSSNIPWGTHFSHYVLSRGGHLERAGNFASGRPLTTLLHDFVHWSNIAKYFGLMLPFRYTEDHCRLTAEVMAEAQRILLKQVKLEGFYVVISPVSDDEELKISQEFMGHLRKLGVKYLDYTHLYDTSDRRYRENEWDGHNSAVANQVIAQKLVEDLGLGSAQH